MRQYSPIALVIALMKVVFPMRQDFFEFTPQFKLLIAGNHKPGLRSVDEAIRRRLYLIPFIVKIPAEERDPELLEKLKWERPGILCWIGWVTHLFRFDGLFSLAPTYPVGSASPRLFTLIPRCFFSFPRTCSVSLGNPVHS